MVHFAVENMRVLVRRLTNKAPYFWESIFSMGRCIIFKISGYFLGELLFGRLPFLQY